ncbi:hypothetical protein XENOCAPTIV_022172 [Xenoophorus captivus]|uniref:Secreted protein n=1 Tax=Xenoophorus captivus TaxID=1517983 RepID=A0ABV0S891_9TELE
MLLVPLVFFIRTRCTVSITCGSLSASEGQVQAVRLFPSPHSFGCRELPGFFSNLLSVLCCPFTVFVRRFLRSNGQWREVFIIHQREPGGVGTGGIIMAGIDESIGSSASIFRPCRLPRTFPLSTGS